VPLGTTVWEKRVMADTSSKRGNSGRRKIANNEPYEVGYFAAKHDISREQARDLIRQIGSDRDKLNAAASKLFRK
jgi:hypothetical protein